jgi:myo-inositol-1(or 4)-monophosphatase
VRKPPLLQDGIRARHDLALEVARAAGALALHHWRNRASLTVAAKASAQDLVSEADSAVERLIRAAVAERFPADGFLGEELGLTQGSSGFTWVIDPIDGTAPYLHGIPNWCVAIAVLQGRTAVAAVIEVPTHGEVFSVLRGDGARLGGAPLRIPPGLTLQNGLTGIGASHRTHGADAADRVRRLVEAGGMFFRNGSGVLMLCYVAAGRLAGYYEPVMHPWDCLGAMLLIEEAGGRCAPFRNGHELLAMDRVLAGAPAAWDDLWRLFGD